MWTTRRQHLRDIEADLFLPLAKVLLQAVLKPVIATKSLLPLLSLQDWLRVNDWMLLDICCQLSLLWTLRRQVARLGNRAYTRWLQNVKDAEYLVERRLLNHADSEVTSGVSAL